MVSFDVQETLLMTLGRWQKLATVAFIALAALASRGWSQGPACDEHPSTEFVLENRATMLWVAGSPPQMGDTTLGVFRIDAPERRVSMRFTASVDKPATSVWLYMKAVTVLPGALLRVSLKTSDTNGQPASGGVSSTFTPQVGWQAVSFPSLLTLVRCQPYHVVLEPETPSLFDSTRYVEFITTISRYPIEFQPEDPGTTGSADSFYDLELTFMVQDSPGPFIAQWKANHYQYNPIFAIQCNDGTRIGQPYDVHYEPHVLGGRLQGQFFELGSPIEVDYVAAFVRGEEGGQDKLEAVLYNATTLSIVFQTEIVRDRPGVFHRAHWFGGTLNPSQQLPAGEYYLMLHSIPSEGRDLGYYPSMSRSTIPLGSASLDGTFGGSNSYAVYSPNGGVSFFPHPGAPDMAFLLGKLGDTTPRSLGIYDEGGVYRLVNPPATSESALTAGPGEVLSYNIQTRNVGPAIAILRYEIIDDTTGVSLSGGPQDTNSTDPNKDTFNPPNMNIAVPSGYGSGSLFRVRLRVGHREGAVDKWDDEARFEVRIL